MSKAARLELEGILAPALRQASSRRITVVDRHTGKPIRPGVFGEVIEGLVRKEKLETEVLVKEEWCSNYPKCKQRTPRSAMSPSRVARRAGRQWTCMKCRRPASFAVRSRAGTLEPKTDASGRRYYRGRVRLRDGSRARI